MLYTNDEFEVIADYFQTQYAMAYEEILEKIGARIQEIGKMTPSDAHQLQQITAYGSDIQEIDAILRKYAQKTEKEMKSVYQDIVSNGYDFAKKFYIAKEMVQVPLSQNIPLQNLLASLWESAKGVLENYSSTSVMGVVDRTGAFVPFREHYTRMIDDAVLLVTTGTEDYTTAISSRLKEMLKSGVRVKYESGRTRELYSAVRMNVLDGCNQIWMNTQEECARQYGSDGVEISAHALCAPDHLDIQGKQFSKAEYEKLNSTLARPIGTKNCRHVALPIVLGVSQSAYTDDELKTIRELSTKTVSSGNWSGTRYEASQRMRRYEYTIRQERAKNALYDAAGDKDAATLSRKRIRELNAQYKNFCKDVGLTPKPNRTRLPKVENPM